MTNAAQTRATRNYRRRLRHRGVARFEVQALETDRELIRALARRLAAADAQAQGARALIQKILEAPKSGCILQALRRSPWVGAEIDVTRAREEGRKIVL